MAVKNEFRMHTYFRKWIGFVLAWDFAILEKREDAFFYIDLEVLKQHVRVTFFFFRKFED